MFFYKNIKINIYLQKKVKVYAELPKSDLVIEMERRKKENPRSVINEWEKNRIKTVFKTYDKGIFFNIIFLF